MKNLFPAVPVLTLIFFLSCSRPDVAEGTPDCVVRKISGFSREEGCSDRTVEKYRFRGGEVYVFQPGTCGADMAAEVISSECETLGYLGGFAGNTEISGESFDNAVYVGTVWKK